VNVGTNYTPHMLLSIFRLEKFNRISATLSCSSGCAFFYSSTGPPALITSMAEQHVSSRAESGFTDLDPDRDQELPLNPEEDLEEIAEQLGIRFFMVSYTTLNSDSRVAIIPKRAIKDVQRHGCGVPAAMFFKADGADPEMNILPDAKTLIQLPWKPEYGWLSRLDWGKVSHFTYLVATRL
jgi:hypothetical protein